MFRNGEERLGCTAQFSSRIIKKDAEDIAADLGRGGQEGGDAAVEAEHPGRGADDWTEVSSRPTTVQPAAAGGRRSTHGRV